MPPYFTVDVSTVELLRGEEWLACYQPNGYGSLHMSLLWITGLAEPVEDCTLPLLGDYPCSGHRDTHSAPLDYTQGLCHCSSKQP
jgi:hypothetical protein